MDIQPKTILATAAVVLLFGCDIRFDEKGTPADDAGVVYAATSRGSDVDAGATSHSDYDGAAAPRRAKMHGGDDVGATDADQPKVSDASLYAFDAVWTSQDGDRMRLSDLAGTPVVVSMIFTSCAHACPMIVHSMKQLGSQLPAAVEKDVQFVLISVDPERDSPTALRRFAQAHGLDPATWTLLRGEAEQVRMMAALLGVRYRKESDGQFAHTSLIAVLDEDGAIAYKHKGAAGSPPDDVAAALLAASN